MRIGEIAALVGVTPRAVRHYHHLGLLPEPERRANGYREYGVRDAVVLARIRRLTELGLGLDEVRDVLADQAGRELVEILEELDGDLARQEGVIRERRARLAELLGQARAGRLAADGPVSAELAELLAELGDAPGLAASPMAVKDRELLTLLDTVVPAEERARLMELMRKASGHAPAVYARLDALADAAPGDPRVAEAAAELAACLPDEAGLELPESGLADVFFGDLSPAQAAAVRQGLRLVWERTR
ncbi:MerR family transcriptional regulator [Streptomyces showdoensis]|uniref:MerR family transcriptional regulator n=1 Tax=Streptomyces showdoensis TaxID=68268 RepID=A0A2P2GDX8_STREW|nr:MerR family transcriptional regulator [Streptomyces showdoensis]KKZ69728.1 MerR family transcriptional regulator [Streptomyces showdoensis]